MSLSRSILTGITLTAFSGNPPNVIIHGIQQISLESLNLGKNSIKITHDGIKSALAGVYATGTGSVGNSLQLEYSNGMSVVDIEGTPYSITYYYLPFPPMNYYNYLGMNFNAFMYIGVTSNNYETIVNNIFNLTLAIMGGPGGNGYPGPSPNKLTQNISWLPNQSSSYWYNYSSSTQDYISQQIIIYAVTFCYNATGGQNTTEPLNQNTNIMFLWTNANNSGPQCVSTIQFFISWPFKLDQLCVQMNSNGPYVYYDPNGSNLPTGMSGLTTLNESDMLSILKVNLANAPGSW
jgi:hypothetical protein